MLVAAVQLELFQMLDDICEAGDMENELFDDLCVDAIQDGRRTGFILMTADLLLSPGSGYKRLLQIRKDQVRIVVCVDHGRDGSSWCVSMRYFRAPQRLAWQSYIRSRLLFRVPCCSGSGRSMCDKEYRDGAGRNVRLWELPHQPAHPLILAPCQDRPEATFYQSVHDRMSTFQASQGLSLRGLYVLFEGTRRLDAIFAAGRLSPCLSPPLPVPLVLPLVLGISCRSLRRSPTWPGCELWEGTIVSETRRSLRRTGEARETEDVNVRMHAMTAAGGILATICWFTRLEQNCVWFRVVGTLFLRGWGSLKIATNNCELHVYGSREYCSDGLTIKGKGRLPHSLSSFGVPLNAVLCRSRPLFRPPGRQATPSERSPHADFVVFCRIASRGDSLLLPGVAAMDSDCGSPGSAAGGPGLKIMRTARSVSATLDGLSPSPSSQRPESRSPSPETGGHRRSQTQRVRDLLSTIDGLVMESEQPEETLARLSPLSPSSSSARENGGSAAHGGGPHPRGRSVRGHKRQSTGGIDSRASRLSRLSLHTPPPRSGGGSGDEEGSERSPYDRAFFPNERDWRGSPFGSTPTAPELAGRRASVVPAAPGDDDEGDPASADMLLAEVGAVVCSERPIPAGALFFLCCHAETTPSGGVILRGCALSSGLS